MKLLKSYLPILFVIVLSFFTVRPLLQPGFFPMHDDTQVARVYEMSKALKDGMLPVRWVADLGYGYGYPIFNFYAPLAYYVGGVIAAVGTDPLVATKVMMIIGMLAAGMCMYLFCNLVWGKAGGILGGVFYAYATYHALDLYVRGDVAEFFAYACIPLAAYGLLLSFRKKTLLSVGIGAIGFAGVIISHNLTALMVAPFLFLFSLILVYIGWKENKKDKRFVFPVISFVGGILLSSFYWLPVPFEMHYSNVLSQVGGGADFRDHFVCLSQLWYSPWGYGGSVPGCVDGLSFMVGKLHFLAVFISIVAAGFLWRKNRNASLWIISGIVGFFISVFLTTAFSKPIWETISAMAFFQYPWRFLLLAAFFSSFLGGGLVLLFNNKLLRVLFVLLLSFGVVLLQYKFFVPQKTLPVSSTFYTNPQSLMLRTSKISDEYMPKGFKKPMVENSIPQVPFSVLHGKNGIVLITEDITQRKEAVINLESPALLIVNIAYFPAWQIYIDGVRASFTPTSYGLTLPITEGKHTVTAFYVSTPIENVGNMLTLTSILLLILAIIYERRPLYGKART